MDSIQLFTRPVYPVSKLKVEIETINVGENVWNIWEELEDKGNGVWDPGEEFDDVVNGVWDPGEVFNDCGSDDTCNEYEANYNYGECNNNFSVNFW